RQRLLRGGERRLQRAEVVLARGDRFVPVRLAVVAHQGRVRQHAIDPARALHNGEVEMALRAAGGDVAHAQVEQRRLGYAQGEGGGVGDAVQVRFDSQRVGPAARTCGDEGQRANGDGALAGRWRGRVRAGKVGGIGVVETDDDRLRAAIEEEVAYREAERMVAGEAAEPRLEIPEAVDDGGAVDRTARGAADEGGDRCGDAGDGPHPAGDFLDVDARVGERSWHNLSPCWGMYWRSLV